MNMQSLQFGLSVSFGPISAVGGTAMHGDVAFQELRSIEGRTATVLMPQTQRVFQPGPGESYALSVNGKDRRHVELASAAETTPRPKGAVGECPRRTPV
ncbi:hypothetical protein CDO52_07900 [Nocardiopsis gilva YIM 90087]|uniref:Uncharacterized protein n=1 Tax=Nocardiopsis gilva YIM 90087 TaxID=1235441 RepID=A0A223S3R3_9ACTN|nr:hypothetical protein [Nocardiopsis gilva]ASU82717.1 hypothetical protein CDO52_07900 [Nocardiopsis gilva YIM 90087]